MTVAELLAKYGRLARELPEGALIPASPVYAEIERDLVACAEELQARRAEVGP